MQTFLDHENFSYDLHKDCVRLVNRSSRKDVTNAISNFISSNDMTCEHIFTCMEDEDLSSSSSVNCYNSSATFFQYLFFNIISCGCFSRI